MKRLLLILVPLLLFPATAFAQTYEPQAKGFEIVLTKSGEDTSQLSDGNINSYISLPEGECIIVKCDGASALMLKWYKSAAYHVAAFNTDGECTGLFNYDNRVLNQYISLSDTAFIEITLPSGGKLSDIIFLRVNDITDDTQVWEAPYDKTDILVIAAHPDDEYLYMGGTIPYYGAERSLRVTAAWMSHQKRLRQDESLAALWAMGVHHYPEFVGFPDKHSLTYAAGARNWGEETTLGAIVELYRKYKPEAVITHDLDGEYGHGAHRVTAAMALKAAEAAADESQFHDSAQEYGTWQIKKLYLHLYDENEIIMDWNQPLNAFGGMTALDMATLGFEYHVSQHSHGFYVSDTYRYSCAKFGLAFTMVGPDIEKDDFLENIPADCLSDYIAPEPEITITPPCESEIPAPEITYSWEIPLAAIGDTMNASKLEPAGNSCTDKIIIIEAALLWLITQVASIVLKHKKQHKRPN